MEVINVSEQKSLISDRLDLISWKTLIFTYDPVKNRHIWDGCNFIIHLKFSFVTT